MTGIERLLELAEHIDACNTNVFIGNAVRDIADQIEREELERVNSQAPRVLDADGVPIEIDDTVWDARGLGPYTVHSFENGGSSVYVDEPERCGITVQHMVMPETLTHNNPEPVDSWDGIWDDKEKSACEYYGKKYSTTCLGCPAFLSTTECEKHKYDDLMRRCRALAEKEAER